MGFTGSTCTALPRHVPGNALSALLLLLRLLVLVLVIVYRCTVLLLLLLLLVGRGRYCSPLHSMRCDSTVNTRGFKSVFKTWRAILSRPYLLLVVVQRRTVLLLLLLWVVVVLYRRDRCTMLLPLQMLLPGPYTRSH